MRFAEGRAFPLAKNIKKVAFKALFASRMC
jgi:hypothetical protein